MPHTVLLCLIGMMVNLQVLEWFPGMEMLFTGQSVLRATSILGPCPGTFCCNCQRPSGNNSGWLPCWIAFNMFCNTPSQPLEYFLSAHCSVTTPSPLWQHALYSTCCLIVSCKDKHSYAWNCFVSGSTSRVWAPDLPVMP